MNTGERYLNSYDILPCKINFTVHREVRFSPWYNNFPPLINTFQLTTVINTLPIISTIVLIVKVVRDIITAQQTVSDSCKTLQTCFIQRSMKQQLTSIWVNLLAFYYEQEVYEQGTERFISGIVQEGAYLGNITDESSNYGHCFTVFSEK